MTFDPLAIHLTDSAFSEHLLHLERIPKPFHDGCAPIGAKPHRNRLKLLK